MEKWFFDNYWAHWGIFSVIIIVVVLIMVMGFIYLERRGIGRFQIRPGPNRCGPLGLLQPIADAIKVLLKEDIVPAKGDKWVHWLAPIAVFVPPLLIFAVIPFHNEWGLISDLNVGIIYIIAISSLSVVGVFMAGWGSSNKFSSVAAMRTIAQMISYEIPLVLAIVGVILVTGSLSMNEIVGAQDIPFFLLQPLGFIIFFIATAAEINRTPTDLLEAESEIVAGYHTEYSGMKFALFYLGEYTHAFAASAIITTLFLSGWRGPAPEMLGWLWFVIKVFLVFFVIFWIRSTIPRLRIDQMMSFAWKCLLPLALINMFITAAEVIVWEGGLPWWLIFVNIAIAAILISLWAIGFKFWTKEHSFGIAKGLGLTFKHLLRHPITTQYPEERLTQSRRHRGNELLWDEAKCTGCLSCQRACPHGVIRIETSRVDKKIQVDKFEADLGLCMFCGLCVEACPTKSLFLGYNYEQATYRRDDLIWDKDKLRISPEKQPSGYAHPEIAALLPQQTLLIDGKRWSSKKPTPFWKK